MAGAEARTGVPETGWDPSAALSIAEAARLSGVDARELRQRIRAGTLLHEVGRRNGREVMLVRLVDLMDAFPDLLVPVPPPGRAGPAESPREGCSKGPEEDPVGEVDRGDRDAASPGTESGLGSRPEVRPTPAPDAPPPDAPSPPSPSLSPSAAAVEEARAGAADEREALRGRTHAFEVRLAAVQASNDALSGQVSDLLVQRTDLKEQCQDLRERLSALERERQTSTAGLLLAQRRIYELEAVGGARDAALPAPSKGLRWAALVAVAALAFVVERQIAAARGVRDLSTAVGGALGDAAGERRALLDRLEDLSADRAQVLRELDATRADLGAQRAQWAAQWEESWGRRWDDLASRAERRSAEEEARRTELVADLSSQLAATRARADEALTALAAERDTAAERAAQSESERAAARALDEAWRAEAEERWRGLASDLEAREADLRSGLADLAAWRAARDEERELEARQHALRAHAAGAVLRAAAGLWGPVHPVHPVAPPARGESR